MADEYRAGGAHLEILNPHVTQTADADPASETRSAVPPAAPAWLGWTLAVAVALATVAVFSPALRHELVAFDDPVYVTGNRHVQDGLTAQGIAWAFTTGHGGNWHPLTWLSHMLDVQLFGHGAAAPHAVNVVLHAVNAALVFGLFWRLTGAVWRSGFVAALFALHPLRVESVAWVSERKDVLCACFFLLSLLAYARWSCRSGDPALHRSRSRFSVSGLWSLVFFGLALLAKPMAVTLPFVLLLLDRWPLRRWPDRYQRERSDPMAASRLVSLVLEKLPFFAVAGAVSTVTFFVQRHAGAVRTLTSYPVPERIANVAISYVRYLGKTLWPFDLAAPYPLPPHWPVAYVAIAFAILAALGCGIVYAARRAPYAVVGSLWFVGMLIPTIGLVQLSDQAMADRYTYLPSIGLFVAVVWAAAEFGEAFPRLRAIVSAAGLAAIVGCAVRTLDQLHYWRDTESLSRRALAVTTGNFIAHNNLGNVLLERGQAAEAAAEFQAALTANPDYIDARVNLGNALLEQGRVDEAIEQLRAAIVAAPSHADAHYNLANALLRKGGVAEAIQHFEQALQSQPDMATAHNNLGNALLQFGQVNRAIEHYRAAIAAMPDYISARHNLAMALRQAGQLTDAIAELRRIVELQPSNASSYNNLGWMLSQAGRLDDAETQLRSALRLSPNLVEAHVNLGKVALRKHRAAEAIEELRAAAKLQPNDPRNLCDLAWPLATSADATLCNGSEAIELARRAEELTQSDDPGVLRTLAAAIAETGQFSGALATASRALELAQRRGDTPMADRLQSDLGVYRSGKALREDAAAAPTSMP